MKLHSFLSFDFNHFSIIIVLSVVIICLIQIAIKENKLNPSPNKKLNIHSKFTINQGCESIEITLFQVNKSYRQKIDQEILAIWLDRLDYAFPSQQDANDCVMAIDPKNRSPIPFVSASNPETGRPVMFITTLNLPIGSSIQFVVNKNLVIVLHVEHSVFGHSNQKLVTVEHRSDLVQSEFDLIAAISKEFAYHCLNHHDDKLQTASL